jgi:DNA-binding PadR family transcriptional regulator
MTERTIDRSSATWLTMTEYAVLGVLGQLHGPVSGYDLRKLIDGSVGYIWQPSKTQLYVVLGRLVRSGLARRREVAQRDRPDKQLYRITAAGRRAVKEWLDSEEPIDEPDRSTLVLKLFFGAQGDREALVRQLEAFRAAYAARLATYEAKARGADPGDRVADEFTALTLRYGIARARAAVVWATSARRELRR